MTTTRRDGLRLPHTLSQCIEWMEAHEKKNLWIFLACFSYKAKKKSKKVYFTSFIHNKRLASDRLDVLWVLVPLLVFNWIRAVRFFLKNNYFKRWQLNCLKGDYWGCELLIEWLMICKSCVIVVISTKNVCSCLSNIEFCLNKLTLEWHTTRNWYYQNMQESWFLTKLDHPFFLGTAPKFCDFRIFFKKPLF